MALAALAKEWADECGIKAMTVTVDHGLRQESGEEARWVRSQLQQLGYSGDSMVLVELGNQLSAAGCSRGQQHVRARNARLDAFKQACDLAGTSHLLTAHHADDQCETFVQRLYRASGISGLACTATSSLHAGVIKHHPLLPFSKARLVATCQARGLEWVQDPSNTDDKYDRARARKGLEKADQQDRTGSLRSDLAAARSLAAAVEAAQLATGRRLANAFCYADPYSGGVWLDGLGLLRAAGGEEEVEAALAECLALATCAPLSTTRGNPQALKALRRHLESAVDLEVVSRWSGSRAKAVVVSRVVDQRKAGARRQQRGKDRSLPADAPRLMFFCHQTDQALSKAEASGLRWDQAQQRLAGPVASGPPGLAEPVRGDIGLAAPDAWQTRMRGWALRADGEPAFVGSGVVAAAVPDGRLAARCPTPWGVGATHTAAGDATADVESVLAGRFIPRAFQVGAAGEPLQPDEELSVRRLGKMAEWLFREARGVSSRKKGSRLAVDAPSAAPVVCRPVDLGDPCLLLLALSLSRDVLAAHRSPLSHRLSKSLDAIEAAAQRGAAARNTASSERSDAVEAEVVRLHGAWASRGSLGPALGSGALTVPLMDALSAAIGLSVVAVPARNVRLIPGLSMMWRHASSVESEVPPRRLSLEAAAAAGPVAAGGVGAEAWEELLLAANEGADPASTLLLAQDVALRRTSELGDATTRATVQYLQRNR